MTPEFCRALLSGRTSRPARGTRRFAQISGQVIAELKNAGRSFEDIADTYGTHEAWVLKRYSQFLRKSP